LGFRPADRTATNLFRYRIKPLKDDTQEIFRIVIEGPWIT
jgi:hypothetical protein